MDPITQLTAPRGGSAKPGKVASLRISQVPATDGMVLDVAPVALTVGTGGAAAGADSVPLSGTRSRVIPAGVVVEFASGAFAVTTAEVATNAASMAVEDLVTGVTAGLTGSYDPMPKVKFQEEVTSMRPAIQNQDIQTNDGTLASSTGYELPSQDISFYGNNLDPATISIFKAYHSYKDGGNNRRFFLEQDFEGKQFGGTLLVLRAASNNPASGAGQNVATVKLADTSEMEFGQAAS